MMSFLKGMDIQNFYGDVVQMNRTNSRQFNSAGQLAPLEGTEHTSFQDVLMKSMLEVNDAQQESEQLMQQMITNPDSVELHDVTIAMARAEMTLNLTRTVIDRAVRAYKEIITLR
jgi:flagellar hook-basal body complex protein FliE